MLGADSNGGGTNDPGFAAGSMIASSEAANSASRIAVAGRAPLPVGKTARLTDGSVAFNWTERFGGPPVNR